MLIMNTLRISVDFSEKLNLILMDIIITHIYVHEVYLAQSGGKA